MAAATAIMNPVGRLPRAGSGPTGAASGIPGGPGGGTGAIAPPDRNACAPPRSSGFQNSL